VKDYIPAQWLPSTNYTRGRSKAITTIVLHHTDGQPRFDRAVEHLTKPGGQVSAHFVVGRGGEVAQLVRLEDTAWHASGVNSVSVGVEHCARTPGELDRGDRWAKLTRTQRAALLDPGAPAELLDSATDPGLQLTDAQLDASAALVAWLLRRLRLAPAAVLGHCRVPGTSHLDCGRDVADGGIWDWQDYRRRLELLDPVAKPLLSPTP
jgi:N-acetyl-anhydromuramyl-L-alanine amidase AmpD